jgi:hypothetical protein
MRPDASALFSGEKQERRNRAVSRMDPGCARREGNSREPHPMRDELLRLMRGGRLRPVVEPNAVGHDHPLAGAIVMTVSLFAGIGAFGHSGAPA